MALALYRKYRPRTFAEVIGQDHVTEPLSQALRSGRLNHAYLFSGPRGCGKTSSARIMARSLNCEQGPTPEPCGQCDSCKSLATDGSGSIDVIEIDAASHGGVDDARELRERAFFAPASSRFKIYVIDEAHMVSSAGFNALLKLVEEPPEYVKFIFATTEPEKVLGTIKSRTHHYPFRLIPPGVLRPYLEQLCESEGVKVDPAVFPLVVRAGGGSARDSLSVLDQLIAGAGPDGVSYARAVALLGVTDAALIDEMCDALAAGDGAAAFGTVDRVAEAGHDPRRFASDLLERLRDLIILQQVPDAVAKGLIEGPADQIERMTAQAARLGPATLSRCADIVHNGLVEMRGTTAPRLLLELISARMLLPGADDSTGGLLQRLERMERRLTLSGGDAPPAAAGSAPPSQPQAVRTAPVPAPSQAPAAPPSPAPASSPASAPPSAPVRQPDQARQSDPAEPATGPATQAAQTVPGGVAPIRSVPPGAVLPDPVTPDPELPAPAVAGAPGELDAAAVRRAWPDVVNMINRSNKVIAALARDAVVRELDGDTLILTVKSGVLAQMVSRDAAVLIDALYEQLGGRWQIRCEVAGADRGGSDRGGPDRGSSPRSRPSGPTGNSGAPRPAAGGPAGRPAGGAPTVGASAGGGMAGASTAGAPVTGAPANGGNDAEDDWPVAARPGGVAPSNSAATGEPSPGSAGSGPAATAPAAAPVAAGPSAPSSGPALSGPAPAGVAAGGTASGSTASGSTASGGTASGGTASRAPSVGAASGGGTSAGRPASVGSPRPAGGGGLAAARAAAAGRGARTGGGAAQGADRARGADPARGAGGVRTAEPDWAGEPPYDPEYDGPVGATSSYEGFDPGDEPLDDVVDERTARQSSEQQAMQLLQQAFGAERIGEVDAR